MKLSVIIPAFKEPYTQKTIDSFLENSELDGHLEILVIWDSAKHQQPIREDTRVKVITLPSKTGMRGAINAGLAEAKGEFIAKIDAHCVFEQGFDRCMMESCASHNWLTIPRRYEVEEAPWIICKRFPGVDYHYFSRPAPENGMTMAVLDWRKDNDNGLIIDDTLAFQGSCWLADRRYFMEKVGFLDDNINTYHTFVGEQVEIGLKYWLNGGEVKINKAAVYGHLRKTRRHYAESIFSKADKHREALQKNLRWIAKHWTNDEEPGMKYPMAWLIEKFNPPGWTEDRSLWRVKE